MEDTNLPEIRKPLGDTSIEELTGVQSKGGDVVLVNLNRAALTIMCGSENDFLNGVQMCNGIKAAIWNEKGITLVLSDRYTVVKYEPPIHQMAEMFFEPEREHYGNTKQWKGNYKPVAFAKSDLLKFLREVNVLGGTEAVVQAVKNMKLRESHHENDVLSLDEEVERTTSTTEETFETNIPKRFSIKIPVTPDYDGVFEFEARVERPSERGRGEDPKQKKIFLHCMNPLEIQKAAIVHVLEKMPKEIPRLYGEMKITSRGDW